MCIPSAGGDPSGGGSQSPFGGGSSGSGSVGVSNYANPVSNPAAGLAGLGFAGAAASSIFGFLGQGAAYKANVQAAKVGFANSYDIEQTRRVQIDQQESENTVSAMINAAAARGRISASASSMGADAATTTQQINAADVDVGRNLGLEDVNSQNQRIQSAQNLTNASLKEQSQINSVAKPNLLALGFNLVGDAASSATQALKLAGS